MLNDLKNSKLFWLVLGAIVVLVLLLGTNFMGVARPACATFKVCEQDVTPTPEVTPEVTKEPEATPSVEPTGIPNVPAPTDGASCTVVDCNTHKNDRPVTPTPNYPTCDTPRTCGFK